MATTFTMTTKVITIARCWHAGQYSSSLSSYSAQLSTQNYIITPYVLSIMHKTLNLGKWNAKQEHLGCKKLRGQHCEQICD